MKSAWENYCAHSVATCIAELATSLTKGLSEDEVHKRHILYGFNEIIVEERTWLAILINQYNNLLTALLCVISSFYIATESYAEAAIIIVILCINGLLGFFQEYRSDKSLRLLQQYLARTINVVRSGIETSLLVRQLVPGDLVILRTGDVVPADIRLIELHRCLLDESVMTGESMPVSKSIEPCTEATTSLLNAQSIAFAGTEVARGTLSGVVIATGRATALGTIGLRAQKTLKMSTFAQAMPKIMAFIGLLLFCSTIVIALCYSLFHGLSGDSINHMVILSFALIISTIPEALPLVITCSLSEGALQLAEHGAVIVKRLSALEDLGHMQILCSDKTGTLTEHILAVAEIFSQNPEQTLLYARLAGAPYTLPQSALRGFDAALAMRLTPESLALLQTYHRIDELSFNPHYQATVVVVTHETQQIVITVGIPEQLIALSPALSAQERQQKIEQVHVAGNRGERVLAVALRRYPATSNEVVTDVAAPYHDFLGIITFTDPIKKSAALAIKKARELNVIVKVISGDSLEVCTYVAQKLELLKSPQEIITGSAWQALSTPDKILALRRVSVFARCIPQDKADIVQMLKTSGTVGYMGDGINDILPLKEAHVALVVQSAPALVYEAGDILLRHKSLLNVVNAIASGRTVVHNVLVYLRITLAASFSNFYSISLAALFIPFPPLFPLHMLIVNLLSDIPLVTISTDHVNSNSLQQPQQFIPYTMLKSTVLLGVLNSLCDACFLALFYKTAIGTLETAWSLWSILSELTIIFSLRSAHYFWRAARPSWQLVTLVSTACIIAFTLPYTHFGQATLQYTPLPATQLGTLMLLAAGYFTLSECLKRWILEFGTQG